MGKRVTVLSLNDGRALFDEGGSLKDGWVVTLPVLKLGTSNVSGITRLDFVTNEYHQELWMTIRGYSGPFEGVEAIVAQGEQGWRVQALKLDEQWRRCYPGRYEAAQAALGRTL